MSLEVDETRFVVDRMLGKLTRWLRLLGFDTLGAVDMPLREREDDILVGLALAEGRVLLTRDKVLCRRAARRGVRCLLLRSDRVLSQLAEVRDAFNFKFEPGMERCSLCNGELRKLAESEFDVLEEKPYVYPHTLNFKEFWICRECGQVYWKGSHWKRIQDSLLELGKV